MCHLYPYNNVKLLRKFCYINLRYVLGLCDLSIAKLIWKLSELRRSEKVG